MTQGKTVLSSAPDFYLLVIYLPHWDVTKPDLTPPRFLWTAVPFLLVLSSFSGECLSRTVSGLKADPAVRQEVLACLKNLEEGFLNFSTRKPCEHMAINPISLGT